MVEQLYAPMERPDPTRPDWRGELRRRSSSVRSTLVRHPWCLSLLASRTGPDRPFAFAHSEAVLATLLAAGFPLLLASRAFVALDSLVHGFALQEVTMPSPAAAVTTYSVTVKSARMPSPDMPGLQAVW